MKTRKPFQPQPEFAFGTEDMRLVNQTARDYARQAQIDAQVARDRAANDARHVGDIADLGATVAQRQAIADRCQAAREEWQTVARELADPSRRAFLKAIATA